MIWRVRVSTSPPNFHQGDDTEASHYVDLLEIDDWRTYSIVTKLPNSLRLKLNNYVNFGYMIHGYSNRQIGIAVLYHNKDEGMMYCGIDYLGNVRSEPAANEALWHVANVSYTLPYGYRLSRDLKGIFGVT